MLDSIEADNGTAAEDKLDYVYSCMLEELQKLSSSPHVATTIEQAELECMLNNVDTPGQPMPSDQYFENYIRTFIKHSINMASPRCLGHMTNTVPEYQQLISEMILKLNQNLVKTEGSRVASIVERQVLGILHRKVYGFNKKFYNRHLHSASSVLGVMTSGATLANITALWCARNSYYSSRDGFSGVEADGMAQALNIYGHKRCVILCSELIHYSVDKAADVLGLGMSNIIKIPVDRNYKMNLQALNKKLTECKTENWHVLAIVGIAGTTDCGSLDPVSELARIACDENIHLHIDAAWGTSLLLSPLRYELLPDIDQADTITLDGHKQLHLPIGTGMLMLRDPMAASTLAKEANYILRSDSGDLGTHSLEGSRPATALFLHAALHLEGSRHYTQQITENILRARQMSQMIIDSPYFELIMPPQTNIVIYLYIPEHLRHKETLSENDIKLLNKCNKNIQQQQYARGMSFVSRTMLTVPAYSQNRQIVVLRAVLVNPETTLKDIKIVLDEQILIGMEMKNTQ